VSKLLSLCLLFTQVLVPFGVSTTVKKDASSQELEDTCTTRLKISVNTWKTHHVTYWLQNYIEWGTHQSDRERVVEQFTQDGVSGRDFALFTANPQLLQDTYHIESPVVQQRILQDMKAMVENPNNRIIHEIIADVMIDQHNDVSQSPPTKTTSRSGALILEDYVSPFGEGFASPTWTRIGDLVILEGKLKIDVSKRNHDTTRKIAQIPVNELKQDCKIAGIHEFGTIRQHEGKRNKHRSARVIVTPNGEIQASDHQKSAWISLSGITFTCSS